MRASGARAYARTGALAAAIGLALVLSGCVNDQPGPTPVTSTPARSSTPTPTATGPATGSPTPAPTGSAPADPTVGQPEPEPSTVTASVTVAGVDVDGTTVSASGFAAGVIEDGGTCTFTFSDGSGVVTADTTAIADVRTTSCGLVTVPIGQFHRGSWTVTVTYASDTTQPVVSTAVPMEVP